MKIFNFLYIAVFMNFLYAISIDEAVDFGLKNDLNIKIMELSEQSLINKIDLAKSSYFPKIDLFYGNSYQESLRPNSSKKTSQAGVEVSYNLFKGFEDYYSLNKANINYTESKFKTNAKKSDLKLLIQKNYIDYLKAQRYLSVRQEALNILEKNYKDTEIFYAQGLIAKNSLLEIKVALAQAKQDLLRARSSLKIARETLNRRIGGVLGQNEIIKDIEVVNEDFEDWDNLIDKAYKNRSEIKALESLIDSINYDIKGANSHLYPKIDLKLSQTFYGDNAFLRSRKDGYSQSTVLGLNIKYNIFDGFANEKKRTSQIYELESKKILLQDLKYDISLQLVNALEIYILARENLKVVKEKLSFAKDSFSITEKRHKAQIETTSNLLKARLDLTQAMLDYVSVNYDIYYANATIQRIVEE